MFVLSVLKRYIYFIPFIVRVKMLQSKNPLNYFHFAVFYSRYNKRLRNLWIRKIYPFQELFKGKLQQTEDKLVIFFIFLRKLDLKSCKLSPFEAICMKCQILFPGKNKKNISNCHMLKILPRVLNIKAGQGLKYLSK